MISQERHHPGTEGEVQSTVQRARIGRVGAILAAGTLIALQAMSGVAGAADTRVLYVGDPADFTTDSSQWTYTVHPTKVSAGQTTYFDVLLRNSGRQTLTNVALGMGTGIATGGLALPAGWTIQQVVPATGCTYDPSDGAGAYDGVSCSLGNLGKNKGVTRRIYLTAGPADGPVQVSGTVSENVGGNVGSNNNTFVATAAGDYFVAGDGKVAGVFKGNKVKPATPAAGGVRTEIDLSSVSSETTVYINENGFEEGTPACPAGFTCLDGASYAEVNDGSPISPYFVWTVTFSVPANFKLNAQTAIVHIFDDGSYEVLYNKNQTSCSRPKIPCADFSLDDASDLLTVVFKTRVNGFVRGKI